MAEKSDKSILVSSSWEMGGGEEEWEWETPPNVNDTNATICNNDIQ